MAQIREFESTTQSYFILDGVSYPKVYEAMLDSGYSDTKIKLVGTNRDTTQLVFSTEYTNILVDGEDFDTASEAISRLNQVVFSKGGGSGDGGTISLAGKAQQGNAPTPYDAVTYPNGLFETYVVRTPLTMPNSWGSAVTQAELDANFVFFDVKNGVVSKELSLKPAVDLSQVIDPIRTTVATSEKSVADFVREKSFLKDEKITLTNTNFYINRNSTIGSPATPLVSSNWLLSQYIEVSEFMVRKGSAIDSSAAAEIYCFDASNNYLGFVSRNSTSYEFKKTDLPEGTTRIRTNSTVLYSGEFSVTIKSKIPTNSIVGLENIDTLNKIVLNIDAFTTSTNGYLDINGNEFNGSSSWRLTKLMPVSELDEAYYTGDSGAVPAIWSYDKNFNKTPLLIKGIYTDKKVIIPANVKYIRATARFGTGFSQKLLMTVYNQNIVDANAIFNSTINDSFFPSKTWAKSGESISLNINGFVNKHPKDYSKDTFFNLGYGNEDFIKITPTADTLIDVKQKQNNGLSVILGSVNLKVATTKISPLSPKYFMHFGDSTVKCTVNSGIEGAIINEVSRRLTGVGYNLTPTTAPLALSLTNINFIGTIGDQVIKHEGRGGWSFSDYLNLQTKSGASNAFWNTETSQFDLGYYLTQNGFVGVDSTASNLTILCQLGWNDVFTYTLAQIDGFVKQWLNLIKSQKSGIKVKLISMQLPPINLYKTYTGNRDQSYVSTMQKVMSIAKIYEAISLNPTYSDWVEHISYMGTFFPENSYPSSDITVNKRDSVLNKVNTDDVHPTAIGYAQMADSLFYNIYYNL